MTKSQKTEKYRNKLVESLLRQKIIKKIEIEKAFRTVNRELFLPNFPLSEVYADASVITKTIGVTPVSSSTSPSLMALMLDILDLKSGQKVLEIGTGTGYNAAILAEIIGNQENVYSLDIDKETVIEATKNLNNAGYQKINLFCRDGAKGWPEKIKFDRIIFTASVKKIPLKVIDQLKVGGLVVLPLWINGTQITPALKKKKDGTLISQSATIGGFMPLRKKTINQILNHSNFKNPKESILICSEKPQYFNYKKVVKLLKTKPKIVKADFKKLTLPRAGNFFRFLATQEPKSVEIFIEKPIAGLFLKNSGAGIIDLAHNSACLFSEKNQIQLYGSDLAFNKISRIYHKWESLAFPDYNRFNFEFSNDCSRYSLSVNPLKEVK